MDYTPAQQQAVTTTEQHLQIIACAGSGKTAVVTDRVIQILRAHAADGIQPENIVAFTFTKKAAAELRDRITRAYQAEFGNIEGIAGMYIGTIHGFCLDMLQRYLFRYLKYDILDDVQVRLLIDRNSVKSGMKSHGLKRYVDTGTYIGILGILREADANGELLEGTPVARALAMYQELLDSHHYFDQSEIQLRAVTELIANPDLRAQVQARVKYVTVDEYQDVSPMQELLIKTLYDLGANLCVVGDDDQNLYQWRGSDVRYIVDFSTRYADGGVLPVPLDVNFRSTAAIVALARHAVEQNTIRLPKQMQSGCSRTFERGDLLALQFGSPEEEAEWIAGKIAYMRGVPYTEPDGATRGLSWSDFAILLRSVKNTGAPIVDALQAHGIPVAVTGMAGLFGTLEAQAAQAIFEYMIESISADQLRAAWHCADVGLSDENLDRGIAYLTKNRSFDSGQGSANRFAVYSLQRTYAEFLDAVHLREENVPNGRGELVYYNLGKFSQAISDFETINYHSEPHEKYRAFVQFLIHQAPDSYPEGGQDQAYAVPDAVRVMTVHQAKGMEFPVVFLPCLQRNRFPSVKRTSRVWQHVPKAAIAGADRYDGDLEDERRLFYVALTRAEKYLFASWAPVPGSHYYAKASDFFLEVTNREHVLTREPARAPDPLRLPPTPRRPLINVELSFTDLKYLFECPYEFKLRLLYGFNAPVHEALGYGRSLHNVLAEIHRRALASDVVSSADAPQLVDDQLNVRYAYPALEVALRNSAIASTKQYLSEHASDLHRLEHVEENVQLALPGGILVNGRIDLIKRTDTGEVAIVDFKSTHRAQPEEVTRLQLHVYALGYEQRFGHNADLIEVCNLDQGGSTRELVDAALLQPTVNAVVDAGNKLRDDRLDRLPTFCGTCERCDYVGICRNRVIAAPTRRVVAHS